MNKERIGQTNCGKGRHPTGLQKQQEVGARMKLARCLFFSSLFLPVQASFSLSAHSLLWASCGKVPKFHISRHCRETLLRSHLARQILGKDLDTRCPTWAKPNPAKEWCTQSGSSTFSGLTRRMWKIGSGENPR